MATGDMKARLLLDSKEFEKNIKKSKKDVDGFKKSGKGIGASFIPQFKAIAAAVGAVKVVEKTFTALINSSQTMGDSFRAEVQAMNTVVDNFVYAMANSDFTSFSHGLDGIIRKAREAYVAYDQLGNTVMASAYVQSVEGTKYRDAMARARNKNLTTEERTAAVEEARAAGAEVQEAARVTEANAVNALAKGLSAKTGLSAGLIDAELLDKFFRLDAKETFEEQRKRLEDDYATYLDEVEVIKDKYPRFWEIIFGAGSGKKGKNELAREAGYEALMEEYKEVIVGYQLLFREEDEELAKMYETAKSAVAAKNQVAEITTSVNEVGVTLAADMGKAAEAAAKLAEETRLARMEQEQLAAFVARNPMSLSPVGPSSMAAPISGTEREEIWQYDAGQDTTYKAAVGRKMNLPSTVGEMSYNPAQEALNAMDATVIADAEEMKKSLEDVDSVVGMLGGSFASLGSSIGGAAGNMLTFVGSALDAAQAIIPLIAQIMAESAAHKANATAAAQDAASKTVSAYAGIPFAGIALGVAGVAAIIGALRSVPKFAEGGIVNRATLGVFGEAGPEAVMPLNKLEEYITPREMRVTGNIKASGKDLVVVLDNYNRVRNG